MFSQTYHAGMFRYVAYNSTKPFPLDGYRVVVNSGRCPNDLVNLESHLFIIRDTCNRIRDDSIPMIRFYQKYHMDRILSQPFQPL